MKKQKGITLIGLVVTIIVLLILAGVTIVTLTGDNGILSKTGQAKIEMEKAGEKDIIQISAIQAMSNSRNNNLEQDNLQEALNQNIGSKKTTVVNAGKNFVIIFEESKRAYTIDENGNFISDTIANIDELAGDITKDNRNNGSSEAPYEISSIEDLVYFSRAIKNGEIDVKCNVVLTEDIDFESISSYKNYKAKYKYDETTSNYIEDENSNKTLMELCTTGQGFIPIDGFKGKFEGNTHTISNIYENRSGYAGLFSTISGYGYTDTSIKNLTISGDITSTDNYAAGFVGLPQGGTIENCTNNANVYGIEAGGFGGYYRYGSDLIFRNCTNNGNIKATNKAGGIIGFSYHGKKFTGCINNGIIEGNWAGGIVGWNEAAVLTFDKCYNNSMIKGNNAGGIVGGLYIGSLRIWNCGVSSNSEIIGTNNAGGILGNHSNYGTNYIYNSYVLGKISGNNNIGGLCGDTFSRSQESGVRVKIENSYFGGTIGGGKKTGGIIGINRCDNLEKLSITNCYYINTISKGISNAEKEGITVLSEEDMKTNNTLLTNLQSYTNSEYELAEWKKDINQYPMHIEQ